MTTLAPTLEAFFTERLIGQRQASPHTISAYRDSFRLLLGFLQDRTGKPPCKLGVQDLDAPTIGAFLAHLENDRHNSVATRNARLAAVHSLFRFAALRHPEHADLIARVLAIPPKRTDRALVSFLTEPEIDALLSSPDRSRWIGRRDHALLAVTIQTGLRVSELVGLRCGDVSLGTGSHLRCRGKGRKERATPLTAATTAVLRTWLRERRGAIDDPLFPTSLGHRLTPDAVERRLAKYLAVAQQSCPSLRGKRLSPHVLRHTCAGLQAGVDISPIALWLGPHIKHETIRTTQIYLHADLALKERALARTAPRQVKPGRYRPTDALLAFLEGL
jgi:site-specific recombinase XerD